VTKVQQVTRQKVDYCQLAISWPKHRQTSKGLVWGYFWGLCQFHF